MASIIREALMINSTLCIAFPEAAILRWSSGTAQTYPSTYSRRTRRSDRNIWPRRKWKNVSRPRVCILDEGATTYMCHLLGTCHQSRKFRKSVP
jgi:hypothetical protein